VDHEAGGVSLSLGKLILSSKEEILDLWSLRVSSSIENARKLQKPIIINTLPAYIDSLADFLSKEHLVEGIVESEGITEEHGGERARLSKYDPSDLIEEYQIFRWAVLEIVKKKGYSPTTDELIYYNHFIDRSVRNSVSAFQLVQFHIREQFINSLTHDLRNPLGAADMAAELILDELNNPNEIVVMVNTIRDNIRRINRMIQDLLDSAQLKSGERLRLNLNEYEMIEIVQNIIKELSLIHGRRFTLDAKDRVKGYWDREAITRAIENVVLNAIKYGDSKEPITIKVYCENERVIISVHNFGNPIPIGEQETIFQAFRRAHSARASQQKGWGLGLPLVRGVAESHGGSVSVSSTHSGGTTFIIDIPIDARPFQEAPITN
jgi:signal transduction histidine kinase